jgi:hypothetical protein
VEFLLPEESLQSITMSLSPDICVVLLLHGDLPNPEGPLKELASSSGVY